MAQRKAFLLRLPPDVLDFPEPLDEEAPTEKAPAVPEPAAAPAASAGESVDKKSMSVADMVAWCREHDGK